MKMQAVLIDGYKNLSDVKINFKNITALVALNNFGKSNVLSAINFGVDFIKANDNDKIDMMSSIDNIPINRQMIGRNYKFEMELSTIINDKEYMVKYGYEFSWKTSENIDPKIVSEYLKIKLVSLNQKYQQIIKRDDSDSFYKSSETGRCSSKIKVDKSELVINKLKAYDAIFYSEIVKKINSIKIYMENNLDAKPFYQPDLIVRKGFENEMINADNLPRVIFKLKEKYPGKFDLLKDVFINLFQDIEDIVVKQLSLEPSNDEELLNNSSFLVSKNIYILYVQDKNLAKPISFLSMSDGAKRVFMILTKLIVANVSNISLIAIEEPENSVHPGLFQAYIRIIDQLLDDCKIIITSHSPYIISYLDPTWIHVGLNKKPGIAEFFTFRETGKNQLQKDAMRFNMSMGDYLFSLLSDNDSNIDEYLECEFYE